MLTSGSGGKGRQGGSTGHGGTSGPGAFQITDWKEELMRKYTQFTIKIEYEPTLLKYIDQIPVVTDNRTNKQYKIKHTTNQSNIMNETEQFIQELIITIRDEKITQVINGH